MGGAVARALLAEGYAVTGMSRRGAADIPPEVAPLTFDLAEGNLDTLTGGGTRCDAIVHAAACLDPADEAALMAVNAYGTHLMAQLASRWNCTHFVYISTVAVYGKPGSSPLHERQCPAPPSLYAATKLFGEHRAALLEPQMHTLSLRIPSPIGPGLRARRIMRVFVERALRDEPLRVHGHGGRRQNYLDVRDVAAAVCAGIRADCSGVVQVGSAEAVSNMNLAQRITSVLGSRAEVALSGQPDPDDHVNWEMDCARARQWLGWQPHYMLEDSIRDLAAEIRRESGAAGPRTGGQL